MSDDFLRIGDAASGASAEVAVGLGLNCFSWKAPFGDGGEPRELLRAEPGFDGGEKRPSRSGIPLMFPFPGRIGGKVFEFGGKAYRLDSSDLYGNAIHGFAMRGPWRVTERAADSVRAEFRTEIDAPSCVEQWPGLFRLEAEYRVAGGRLELDFAVESTGDEPAPFGFGTHAYFRLPLAEGSDAEATVVRAPVATELATAEMLPTGEETAIGPTEPLPAGAPLAGRVLDAPHRLSPGGGATELLDPATGRVLRQTFDDSMTCLVLYTPDHREAICLEPQTCTPDPFALAARGVETGLRVLEPGASYRTKIVWEATLA